MNIEDIRLTEEEKMELRSKLGGMYQREFDLIEVGANTATDKANKWWINYLKSKKDTYLGYDWLERGGAPIEVFTLDPLDWQALKKLVAPH